VSSVDYLEFRQYGPNGPLLYQFNASASELIEWAGIPRKTTRLRMLYQRIFGDARKR
jgi:hypothetical protein